MSEDYQPLKEYQERAKQIQKRCACHRLNPRECYLARYGLVEQGLGDDFHKEDDSDDECECGCHEELRELEEELWPDRDDA